MRVSDFHFELPEELIAQHPPAERGASRMLVLHRQGAGETAQGPGLVDAMFRELPQFLRAGDVLVLNDSRVLPARLFARRRGLTTQAGSPRPAGVVEVLLVEEEQGPGQVWRALVRPARKVAVGEWLEFFAGAGEVNAGILPLPSVHGQTDGRSTDEAVLTAEVIGAGEFGERVLRFAPVEDFYGRVERIGHMPLPPYIRREQDAAEDRERYQTVYAQRPGSAAAPTAGLHFTPEMLAALAGRGVEIQYVTLHVGLGTFQPVRVAEVKDIRLHAERYTLPATTAEALNRARAEGRRIVAVGTTTTRTLEHVAAEAGEGGRIEGHSGLTSIFLGPRHRFRLVGALLTNFHLPESTLLMLVSAFAGREQVLAAYAHAVRQRYRFFSYGDCMLLIQDGPAGRARRARGGRFVTGGERSRWSRAGPGGATIFHFCTWRHRDCTGPGPCAGAVWGLVLWVWGGKSAFGPLPEGTEGAWRCGSAEKAMGRARKGAGGAAEREFHRSFRAIQRAKAVTRQKQGYLHWQHKM